MGSQAKTQPLSQGASNAGEGQTALQSLMGGSSAGQAAGGQSSGGGQDTAILQQYLQSLLGSGK